MFLNLLSSTIRPWTSLVWTNTISFSVVFGAAADDGVSFSVDGASDGVADCAAVAEVTGVVGAGVVVDSSANAAPPEVAIANPTIVADANVYFFSS